MKTKVSIIAITLLVFLGTACQKKDALSTKLDELNKEYQDEQIISKKEYDLKVATIKAGKELPTSEQAEQEGPVKVEIIKPIPTQSVPAPAPVAKAPATAAPAASTPVAKAPAPVKAPPALIAAPAAPATQTAKVGTKVTTEAPPAAPAATATPAAIINSFADTLGKGGATNK